MENLLKRLKLIDQFKIEINTDKFKFIKSLEQIVEKGDTGTLFSGFEALSSSKFQYKGHVSNQGFELRKKRKLFDMSLPAKAEGSFHQKENKLLIDVEANAMSISMKIFYVGILLIYSLFIVSFIYSITLSHEQSLYFVLPFIMAHGLFMAGLPYIMMKRGLKQLRYDLEREFHYISR